jgi:hypothetical protein
MSRVTRVIELRVIVTFPSHPFVKLLKAFYKENRQARLDIPLYSNTSQIQSVRLIIDQSFIPIENVPPFELFLHVPPLLSSFTCVLLIVDFISLLGDNYEVVYRLGESS